MIAMAVIGILAAIAIPNFIAYKDKKRQMEMEQPAQEELLHPSDGSER